MAHVNEQGVIVPSLGEIDVSVIKAARRVAKALLESEQPRYSVSIHLPDGREVSGVAFVISDGVVVVAAGFLAIGKAKGGSFFLYKFIPLTSSYPGESS